MILGQQIVWIICVLSAADSSSAFGLIAAAVYLSVVLYFSPDRREELKLLLSMGLIAFSLDSLLITTEQIQFASPAPFCPNYLAPPWMLALWLCFTTLAPRSLSFLKERYLLASVLGAFAGPLTYYSAMKMGAATMSSMNNLVFVALEYAVAMPILIYLSSPLNQEIERSSRPDKNQSSKRLPKDKVKEIPN